MPFTLTPAVATAVTVDGTAAGVLGVASTTDFYPGARVWLVSDTVSPKEYMVTDILSATTMGLREILPMDGGARYGRTSLAQWTVATNAKIAQERGQVVDVELSNLAKIVKL